jgi:hypothetical protein
MAVMYRPPGQALLDDDHRESSHERNVRHIEDTGS